MQNNSRPCTEVQDRLLVVHWEVRSSSVLQQAAGQLPHVEKWFDPFYAVGHNVADPCTRCVLARGNGIPSQCDGDIYPSQGNLLPLAVAGTQATGSILHLKQDHGSMSRRLADHVGVNLIALVIAG